MTEIRLYCSLAKTKKPLTPLIDGQIGMYACGVTVYDVCHIGHAMQAIFFDIYRRFLEGMGYRVVYVRNYTDIDDKIIQRAKTLGLSPRDLSEKMIQSSIEDFHAIGVRPASYEPKVSESIPEITDMIETLIDKGFAYRSDAADVYYKVRQKSDYGKLSNRRPDELVSGTRDLVGADKSDPLDFALWKTDADPQCSWASPFGQGRPGWHIECSAMAKKFLGVSFDIHGGGLDLVFPHHENELAQSEAANDAPFASIWMHCGLLTLNKQKMSKSLGNSITIQDFLKDWPAEVLRFAFIQNHYRSMIDFSEDFFKGSLKRLLYYYQSLQGLEQAAQKTSAKEVNLPLAQWQKDFTAALCDDFNTPQAIALINTVLKTANQAMQKRQLVGKQASDLASMLKGWGEILGLLQEPAQSFIEKLKAATLQKLEIQASHVEDEIARRQEARAAKNWTLSDEIRNGLAAQGILLNDGEEGTTWTVQVD